MKLQGKKVIVLGGSSGIGLATAKAAAEEGAHVIIVSSNKQKLSHALEELPRETESHVVDLSKEENIHDFFKGIKNFDHLVFSAGENLTLNSIDRTNISEARDFFKLRFWSAFAAVKYGAPFINAGGSISLISGTASARPGSGWSVASCICGAIEAFVRAMAVELAPIRVNCVVAGVIRTSLWSSMTETDRENFYKTVADVSLVKRIGTAEDVAQGFVYLMKQDFGTGHTLVVDGGTLLV